MFFFLKKLFRNIALAPVLLVLLFEEWGWEPLARAFARLGQLPLWARLEGLVTGLPPWAALLAFGVPVMALIPIKFLALYLFGQGHMATGLTLVMTTKVAGTALTARLFQLTEPALMRLAWFARLYAPWKRWKDRLLAQVRESAIWRAVHKFKYQMRRMAQKVWTAYKDKRPS